MPQKGWVYNVNTLASVRQQQDRHGMQYYENLTNFNQPDAITHVAKLLLLNAC